MSRLTFHTGDLFDLPFVVDAVAHGVNCQGVMGSGIALEFRARYTGMHKYYVDSCQRCEWLPGDVLAYRSWAGRWVYNLFTQRAPGADARLPAISRAMSKMLQHASNHGVRTIAIPRIGSGVGGLDWADVEAAMRSVVEMDAGDVSVIVISLAS